MIPYGRQSINEDDINAVVRVLRSDYLTQGPEVPRFEQAVAAKVGVKHAIAVNSATSALHVACLALGVGPGDLVWTSPTTFVASANCARYCGADVDFVDIDPQTWNMSVPVLESKLSIAEKDGRLPKVVIPVHLGGHPCDMKEIFDLGRKYGFRVIEDASHAIGSTYLDTHIGACRFSDITVYSFHPVKIITCGEGGMALTNDDGTAQTMSLLRSHGITREASRLETSSPPRWYYEQQLLGYNYRMTDLEAALGTSQLHRLDEYVARRQKLARLYDEAFVELPVRRAEIAADRTSAYHLYVVRLGSDDAAEHRRVFDALIGAGIGVNLHYMPVHLQPDFKRLGFKVGMFPEAEAYARSAITLPIYPDLTDLQQSRICDALKETVDSDER